MIISGWGVCFTSVRPTSPSIFVPLLRKIGYLGWEYPASQLLQRLPLGKYSAICVVLWGLVLSCFAAVDNFGGAVAIRLLLGICEASVTPGFALLTSQVR